MKLVTFCQDNYSGLGWVIDDYLIDARADPALPNTMIEFLAAGESALAQLRALAESGAGRLPLNSVKLVAPVPKPGKYLAVGLNYREHIDETHFEKPDYPLFFNKQTTCVSGPEQAIVIPKGSGKVDYEGELAMVIGQRCRYLTEVGAKAAIAGFTVANDVSVRDWQMRSPTWTLGKSFDSHGPLGPWLVTADEISDPNDLRIQTWVDGELRQDARTSAMIFDCYALVEYLSQAMTLEPGDIIATGTPAGVGVKMKPRGYLRPGQRVTIEIEKIGRLSNPVVAETD